MSRIRRCFAAHRDALLYVAAGVSYVGVGLFEKAVLNWVVGPAWLLAWAWGLPALARALRRPGNRSLDRP